MRKVIFCLTLCVVYGSLFGQRHDYNWPLGYAAGGNEYVLVFTDSFPHFEEDERDTQLGRTMTAVSDSAGVYQLVGNGFNLSNSNGDFIENGTGLSPGPYADDWASTGSNGPQTMLILPRPRHDSLYDVIHLEVFIPNPNPNDLVYSTGIYHSVVDMSTNGGNGAVTVKNDTLFSETVNSSGLTACRHANGRDWWVLVPDSETGDVFNVLIGPEGAEVAFSQSTDSPEVSGLIRATISPQGDYYIRDNLFFQPTAGARLDVFAFDRCSGLLSDYQSTFLPDTSITLGVAVSPNSQYLYKARNQELLQFDLQAADLEQSKVVIDTNNEISPIPQFPRFFGNLQNAPDGKIYAGSGYGWGYLHTIDYPDRPGTESHPVQLAMELPPAFPGSFPSATRTIPNFPNFRLGPIDGSPCDTLDIDNLPLADFRADTTETLEVIFTNTSSYEPTDFVWTFGDGNGSTEKDPVHPYALPGYYEVCLTASNSNGSDTKCKLVRVSEFTSTTSVPETAEVPLIIYPNPTRGRSIVEWPAGQGQSVEVFNFYGRSVLRRKPSVGAAGTQIDLSDFAAGTYVVVLRDGFGRVVGRARVVLL